MLYRFDRHEPVVGKDTYVSETAIVIGDVQIGDNCYIGHGAILRGDYGRIEIGDKSAVEEGVIVHAPPQGLCAIGEGVTIGHGAIIHSRSIGAHTVIGMGAVASIMAEIGEKSIVAEGCIVKNSQKIPANVVVGGNPAKILREIEKKDKSFWGDANQVYVNLALKYIKEGMQRVD
jgi:carbonic anhydrase/acetyltransferase-like protein (isoleucine patch superfamily)